MSEYEQGVFFRQADGVRRFVSEDSFSFFVDLEVQKALRLRYCFSVLCIRPEPCPEIAASSLIPECARIALGRLRATDLAAGLTPASLGILLIDAEVAALPAIYDRIREELDARCHGLKKPNGRFHWQAGGACFPATAASGRDLLAEAIRLMNRAGREGSDRLYLSQ